MLLSPDYIFRGEIPILDANIFDENVYNSGLTNFIGMLAPSSSISHHSLSTKLKAAVSNIYVVLRNLSAIILLCLLIYTGIRILITNVSPYEQAKWKAALIDWTRALITLMFMHLLMIGIFYISDKLVDSLTQSFGGVTITTMIRNSFFNSSIWDTTEVFVSLILYTYTTWLTIIFALAYFKRLSWIVILIITSPFVAITQALGNKYKNIFAKWLKEYTFAVLAQPFHIIIFYVLVALPLGMVGNNVQGIDFWASLEFTTENLGVYLYALLAMSMIRPAEKFLYNLFGFNESQVAGQATSENGVKTLKQIEKVVKEVVKIAGTVVAAVATGGAAAAATAATAGAAAPALASAAPALASAAPALTSGAEVAAGATPALTGGAEAVAGEGAAELLSSGGELPLGGDEMSLGGDGMSLGGDGMSLEGDGMSLGDDGMSLEGDGMSLGDDGMSLRGDRMSLGDDGMSLGNTPTLDEQIARTDGELNNLHANADMLIDSGKMDDDMMQQFANKENELLSKKNGLVSAKEDAKRVNGNSSESNALIQAANELKEAAHQLQQGKGVQNQPQGQEAVPQLQEFDVSDSEFNETLGEEKPKSRLMGRLEEIGIDPQLLAKVQGGVQGGVNYFKSTEGKEDVNNLRAGLGELRDGMYLGEAPKEWDKGVFGVSARGKQIEANKKQNLNAVVNNENNINYMREKHGLNEKEAKARLQEAAPFINRGITDVATLDRLITRQGKTGENPNTTMRGEARVQQTINDQSKISAVAQIIARQTGESVSSPRVQEAARTTLQESRPYVESGQTDPQVLHRLVQLENSLKSHKIAPAARTPEKVLNMDRIIEKAIKDNAAKIDLTSGKNASAGMKQIESAMNQELQTRRKSIDAPKGNK